MPSLRALAAASLVALVALIVLSAAALLSQEVGPAARVTVHAYLISAESAALVLYCGVVALLLGFETYRRVAARHVAAAERPKARVLVVTKLALALLAIWALLPQLTAFPRDGSAQERAAWARSHVPQYAGLVGAISRIPEVAADVGSATVVAPTSGHPHRAAQDMNGMWLAFELDVHGPKGHGVLQARCLLDQAHVVQWEPGRWTFAGTTRLVSAPR